MGNGRDNERARTVIGIADLEKLYSRAPDPASEPAPAPFCAAYSPPYAMFITGLREGVTIEGFGAALSRGQHYLVLGLGVLSDGTVLALTKDDNGLFIWVSEEECGIGVAVPQSQSPIIVPGLGVGMKPN